MLSMESFSNWLLAELKSRDMSQSDLAHIAKLGSGTISNIMTGNRKVGQDTLTKIAHALKLPPDLVFEKAGILPPKPEVTLLQRLLLHASEGLPESDIALATSLLEQRREFYKKNPGAKPTK